MSSFDLNSLNKTFKANIEYKEPYSYVSASLDLANLPLGTYYFNSENNFNYTKNWFNYSKFISIPENTILKEVIQFGDPEVVPNTLDMSKNYVLDSTSLNATWRAKIEPGTPPLGIIDSQISKSDSLGNLYVAGAYYLNSADVYNSSGALGASIPITTSEFHSYLTKYDPAGNYLWSTRLTPGVGTNAYVLAMTTSSTNDVYISGWYGYPSSAPADPSNGVMTIYNSDGTPYYYNPLDPTPLSIPVGSVYSVGNPIIVTNGFLIKYDSLGMVQWATQFSKISPLDLSLNQPNGPTSVITRCWEMSMDTDSLGNVYITTQYGSENFIAYDAPGLINNIPSLIASDNPYNTILVKYDERGVAQWSTRMTGNNKSGYGTALSIDDENNIYVTGVYSYIDSIYNAPGQSSNVSSVLPPPPSTKGIDWSLEDTSRQWKTIASNGAGDKLVAAVRGGNIYTSVDNGDTWVARETPREWDAVASDNSGNNLVAVVYGGQIYTSTNAGITWTPRETNRNWVAVASSSTGQRLVATEEAGRVYNSADFGVTWSVDFAPGVAQNWNSVSMDDTGLLVVASTSTAGKLYRSVDGGNTFNLLPNSPIQTWGGVATNNDGTVIIGVVNGGYVYQSVDSGVSWNTRFFATIKAWNYVYCNHNATPAGTAQFVASVNNGQIYLSNDRGSSWDPANNIRPWTCVTCNADFTQVSGTINGQNIQRGEQNPLNLNTYLVKYDLNGQCQWITYAEGGRNNGITSVYNPSTKSVIISGRYNDELSAYDANNFDLVSAIITTPTTNATWNNYIINYNLNGLITWEAKLIDIGITSGDSTVLNMLVDNQGNFYLTGTFNERLDLYSSDSVLSTSLIGTVPGTYWMGFIAKYFSNGIVQSATLLESTVPLGNNVIGRGLGYDSASDSIYAVGKSEANGVNIYESDGTLSPLSPLLINGEGTYVIKYAASATPSFPVQPPNYNSPFEVEFKVGGNTKRFVDGYLADQEMEVWGGQTGYTSGPVTLNDLNAGVICSYGHEMGNTRPFVAGIPSTTATTYRCLSVALSEPSFPVNDPQPETPGAVIYGFIPFYISVPAYATGVVFNTQLYNSSNLIMSTTGPVVSNQSFGGLSIGDVIRIILIDPLSTGSFINLTVKGFIVSDATVFPNIQAGVIFEETTYYVSTEVAPISLGLPRQCYTTLLPNNTLTAFYQPKIIKQGKINVILKLYPKYAP